jgi:7-cyano-7-deazaguanine reductase
MAQTVSEGRAQPASRSTTRNRRPKPDALRQKEEAADFRGPGTGPGPEREPEPYSPLGNARPDGHRMIHEARLERFENRAKHRKYWVEFTCPEFTCICPASGFPDFATLQIRYQPRDWCVELKSLKLYINQYRDQGAFHEEVINLILDDLVRLLDPWKMEIVGDFNVRGNIKTIVRARHKAGSKKGQKGRKEMIRED